ncbi:MAG: hypothetical protein QM736_20725 [Vicinamibacterales bacterium]
MLKRLFVILLLAAPVPAMAAGINRNAPVVFNGCAEYVGFGPVPLADADALVPRRFTVTDLGGVGGIVVRAARCSSISVDGAPGIPAMVSHVGVNIQSPDGTGDINNFTIVYATNHRALAEKLRKTGIPVVFNPMLVAEDPAAFPGDVYISVFGRHLPAYSITGTVNAPSFPPIPFLANWWAVGDRGVVKMATDIPSIAFGIAALEFRTSSDSTLGRLIGGNSFSNFPFYDVRGEYVFGRMDVTTGR